jgi:hypothetical protein
MRQDSAVLLVSGLLSTKRGLETQIQYQETTRRSCFQFTRLLQRCWSSVAPLYCIQGQEMYKEWSNGPSCTTLQKVVGWRKQIFFGWMSFDVTVNKIVGSNIDLATLMTNHIIN